MKDFFAERNAKDSSGQLWTMQGNIFTFNLGGKVFNLKDVRSVQAKNSKLVSF